MQSTTRYDANDGRLNSFTNPESQQTSFTYDPMGRVQKKTMVSAGLYEQYGYDARWRVDAITVKNVSDDAVRRALGYAYDDASRIAQFTATGADPTIYGYDAAGLLTSETRGSYAASYQYDGNGNRTYRTVNGVTEAYAYDDGDKLQSVTCGTDVRAFAYDERGRRTAEYLNGVLERTYAWNEDDRLAGIAYSNPPGTPFAGAYGPDGARVARTDSGGARVSRPNGPAYDSEGRSPGTLPPQVTSPVSAASDRSPVRGPQRQVAHALGVAHGRSVPDCVAPTGLGRSGRDTRASPFAVVCRPFGPTGADWRRRAGQARPSPFAIVAHERSVPERVAPTALGRLQPDQLGRCPARRSHHPYRLRQESETIAVGRRPGEIAWVMVAPPAGPQAQRAGILQRRA